MTEFATRCVHAGLIPDPSYGSVIPAIHQSSTFVQGAPGQFVAGFDYARSSNPTRAALETALGELEGGLASAFSSGMAAEHALITAITSAGSHIVLPNDLYGGTYRLVDKVLSRFGLEYDMVDQRDLDAVAAAVRDDTALVWVETPTNPSLNVIDLAGVIDRKRNALVVVDNTFATPYLQQPLELGADVVVHSTTKYCGGHSDIIGGALVVNDDDLADQLRFHQNAIGGVASPFDCWLVLRGLRTLAVRMERHCDNAEVVAAFLEEHPRIAQVYFPGLDAHPGHDLAKRQMRRYGGMVSFRVVGGEQAALQVCEGTSVIILGESLGGVESLIEHPHTMTHASVAGTQLEVPGDLIRLSVGIEDAEDLVADLDKALA
jgi:cystathionine gamma-synthase